MKFFNGIFLRCIALLLLVTFTFVSCPIPTGSHPPPGEPPVVITPGEGNPRYVYLDSQGEITDVDEGRTVLFVEDNKNAAGVLIVSETGIYNKVSIYNHNNNSIVSMFYKPDSNFPYYMIIQQDEDVYYAYLSYYKSDSSAYDIVFEKDGEYSPSSSLVLNKNIFTVYQDDAALNASQNLRLRNITIALGLWGSLYNFHFFEPEQGNPVTLGRAISFKSFVNSVKKVFKAVAVIAVVVAVVVAPVVAFVDPVAGVILHDAMLLVAAVSTAIVLGLIKIKQSSDDDGLRPPEEVYVPVLKVENWYEKKPVANGQEFHIGIGKDVLLEFSSPGADFTKVQLSDIFRNPPGYGYEPGNPVFPESRNSSFFKVMDIERSIAGTDLPPDCFLVRIKRLGEGFIADGKVAFGFEFPHDNLYVNGTVQPVEFKYYDEKEPKMRTNMVVVWFCIYPYCPDYVAQ